MGHLEKIISALKTAVDEKVDEIGRVNAEKRNKLVTQGGELPASELTAIANRISENEAWQGRVTTKVGETAKKLSDIGIDLADEGLDFEEVLNRAVGVQVQALNIIVDPQSGLVFEGRILEGVQLSPRQKLMVAHTSSGETTPRKELERHLGKDGNRPAGSLFNKWLNTMNDQLRPFLEGDAITKDEKGYIRNPRLMVLGEEVSIQTDLSLSKVPEKTESAPNLDALTNQEARIYQAIRDQKSIATVDLVEIIWPGKPEAIRQLPAMVSRIREKLGHDAITTRRLNKVGIYSISVSTGLESKAQPGKRNDEAAITESNSSQLYYFRKLLRVVGFRGQVPSGKAASLQNTLEEAGLMQAGKHYDIIGGKRVYKKDSAGPVLERFKAALKRAGLSLKNQLKVSRVRELMGISFEEALPKEPGTSLESERRVSGEVVAALDERQQAIKQKIAEVEKAVLERNVAEITSKLIRALRDENAKPVDWARGPEKTADTRFDALDKQLKKAIEEDATDVVLPAGRAGELRAKATELVASLLRKANKPQELDEMVGGDQSLQLVSLLARELKGEGLKQLRVAEEKLYRLHLSGEGQVGGLVDRIKVTSR